MFGSFALVGCMLAALGADEKAALKAKLGDEAGPRWHYDDLPAGLAEAKRTGKPLCVAIRCTH